MNVWEMVSKLAREHEGTDEEAALELLRQVGVKATAADFLCPLVADRIAHRRRDVVRGAEYRAFGGSTRRELAEVIDSRSDRKRLLDASFALGDGRFVRWGEATVADHAARIDLLAAQRAGLDATIQRHREAIAAIQNAGVSCLDDIEAHEMADA